ncbi:nitrous oxide reductase accessory protein NosL [Roseovarius sp. PS-C2]|uniref:nitrous oxide reductase accessory protein NosL n=1 Tax=Roseovarius sp. PS-C2 TaxID=2820814 RepID=UPI001C0E2DDD|nr:nitrous oxide reductase accessory protein NosL [Roseovarius sp. PS-C2]MBU3260030.1 nitrous oxide reductase accessory protein NosL [Roseovarius sp. PS-C2]
MKRLAAILCLAILPACQEDTAEIPQAVTMTASAVGHFCQMNMLEHPGPKAQVHLTGLPGTPLFFSQVRDAVAYLRMPEQSHEIAAVYVSDMGSAASWEIPGADNWIPASAAHYVVGSSRTGGMGAPELVPFSDAASAAQFAQRHGGQVQELADIPDTAVLAPVATSATTPDDDDFADRLRALSQERTN